MSASTRFSVNGLLVHIASSRAAMGHDAAAAIADDLRSRLQTQAAVRMVFAAAPSQAEMLAELRKQQGIDWARVAVFHMDEYLGLPLGSPHRFGTWLRAAFFDHLPFAAVHLIEPGRDSLQTAADYAAKLAAAPIDIVCCGIGVNGHLAFNDPPADFDDPMTVKIVNLDDQCRQQQVDDRCFSRLEDVPLQALTLTVPTLLSAHAVFCTVPGIAKRAAVSRALRGAIDPMCPASALRRHPNCTMFLDLDSSFGLEIGDRAN